MTRELIHFYGHGCESSTYIGHVRQMISERSWDFSSQKFRKPCSSSSGGANGDRDHIHEIALRHL